MFKDYFRGTSFFSISPLIISSLVISDSAILPKDTSGKDLRLSGQCLSDGLLAVDPYGAVVLFVHDRLNWTVAGAVQLKMITFRCSEIKISGGPSYFFFAAESADAD